MTARTASPPAPARGRPRQFDVAEAEARALTLFDARGYDRVSLVHLTRAMGINPPSFYAAFGSKANLFRRVLASYCEAWFAELGRAFATDQALRDQLADILLLAAHRFSAEAEEEGLSAGPQPVRRGGCLILEAGLNCSDELVAAAIRKARLALASLLYRSIARSAPEQAAMLTDYMLMQLSGLSALAREGTGRYRLYAAAQMAGTALPHDPA